MIASRDVEKLQVSVLSAIISYVISMKLDSLTNVKSLSIAVKRPRVSEQCNPYKNACDIVHRLLLKKCPKSDRSLHSDVTFVTRKTSSKKCLVIVRHFSLFKRI